MKRIIKHSIHTIEITTEHTWSSYGILALVVDGDYVMQVPLTKEEREHLREMIRFYVRAHSSPSAREGGKNE